MPDAAESMWVLERADKAYHSLLQTHLTEFAEDRERYPPLSVEEA